MHVSVSGQVENVEITRSLRDCNFRQPGETPAFLDHQFNFAMGLLGGIEDHPLFRLVAENRRDVFRRTCHEEHTQRPVGGQLLTIPACGAHAAHRCERMVRVCAQKPARTMQQLPWQVA